MHATQSIAPTAARIEGSNLASPIASGIVIAAFLLAGVVLVVALSVQLPKAGAQTVLFFDPSVEDAQAMGALIHGGGRLIDVGAAPTILVARFERDLSWSDLHAMGVWAAFDPSSLVGCLAAPSVS